MLTAYAELNHGRWIVPCPVCPSAQALDGALGVIYYSGDPAVFICAEDECEARAVVIVPDQRAEIDALVADRPLGNRNWRPGETLAQLLAENAAHLGVS